MTLPVGPLDPPWPDRITGLRESQVRAIDQIVTAFERGKRIVVLEAPTGSGKTVIGEAVRRRLGGQALYVCTDKVLQDQFEDSFPYARILKGRRNYATLDVPERTAEDCDASEDPQLCATCVARKITVPSLRHCSFCHPISACPYRVAKRAAREARLGCTNTSYLLTEANGPGEFSGWPLIIVDEADRLESALMGHVELRVSAQRWASFDLDPPRPDTPAPTWAMWIDAIALPAMREAAKRLIGDDVNDDEDRGEKVAAIRALGRRLADLRTELAAWRWVAVPTDRGGTTFRPVRVRQKGPELLWRHAERWLLMSATILDARRLLWTLGADAEPWTFVSVPSSFDPSRRPIVLSPVAQVTRKNPGAPMALASALRRILTKHLAERILVHTVSHRLAGQLAELLDHDHRLVVLQPGRRDEALTRYLAMPDGVLLAAGLERGVDLADDACRVVVVAKCPWPDLSDPQVAARVHGLGAASPSEKAEGRTWYAYQALAAVIQMTGRGMRHEDDRCVTYLLDQQLMRLLDLRVPDWWREAVRAEPL